MKEDAMKKKFLHWMTKFLEEYKRDTIKTKLLYSYCGGSVDNWFLDMSVDLLDELFSPEACWIGWWIFETECGERDMEAGYDGNMKVIKTLDDLWWLITEEANNAD